MACRIKTLSEWLSGLRPDQAASIEKAFGNPEDFYRRITGELESCQLNGTQGEITARTRSK